VRYLSCRASNPVILPPGFHQNPFPEIIHEIETIPVAVVQFCLGPSFRVGEDANITKIAQFDETDQIIRTMDTYIGIGFI